MRRIATGLMEAGSVLAGFIVVLVAVGIIANIVSRVIFGTSIVWVLEFSEYALVAAALIGAGSVTLQRRHTAVDIVLRLVSHKVSYALTRLADVIALVILAIMTWCAILAVLRSHASGAMLYKFVVFPEWWLLCLLPIGLLMMSCAALINLLSPIRQADAADPGH